MVHGVRASPETVSWGDFDSSTAPVRYVGSGDIVVLAGITHYAGDAPGWTTDDGVREIHERNPPAICGPGSHIVPTHVVNRKERMNCTLPEDSFPPFNGRFDPSVVISESVRQVAGSKQPGDEPEAHDR